MAGSCARRREWVDVGPAKSAGARNSGGCAAAPLGLTFCRILTVHLCRGYVFLLPLQSRLDHPFCVCVCVLVHGSCHLTSTLSAALASVKVALLSEGFQLQLCALARNNMFSHTRINRHQPVVHSQPANAFFTSTCEKPRQQMTSCVPRPRECAGVGHPPDIIIVLNQILQRAASEF